MARHSEPRAILFSAENVQYPQRDQEYVQAGQVQSDGAHDRHLVGRPLVAALRGFLCQILDLLGLLDREAQEYGQRCQRDDPRKHVGADEPVDHPGNDDAEETDHAHGTEAGEVSLGGVTNGTHHRKDAGGQREGQDDGIAGVGPEDVGDHHPGDGGEDQVGPACNRRGNAAGEEAETEDSGQPDAQHHEIPDHSEVVEDALQYPRLVADPGHRTSGNDPQAIPP